MRNFFNLFLFLFTIQTGFAQSKSYEVYDALKDKKGYAAYYMNEDFLTSLDSPIDPGVAVDGKLTEIRMIFCDTKKADLQGRSFRKHILRLLPRPPYRNVAPAPPDSIDAPSDPEWDDMEFWVLGEDNNISECHIIMEDHEYGILLSFYGEIIDESIITDQKPSFWNRLFNFKWTGLVREEEED